MRVFGIQDIDLNGYLFIRYPIQMSIEESRERLELEVYSWSMSNETHELIKDETTGESIDISEPIISPSSLYLIDWAKREDAISKLSPDEMNKLIKESWAIRNEKRHQKLHL